MTWTQAQVDAIQAYYVDHAPEIFSSCYEDPLFEQNKTVTNLTDHKMLFSSSSTEMLQSYQIAWTPKGSVNMGARELVGRRVKIDLEEAFQDLSKEKYFSHLRRKQTNDPYYNVPYYEWILQGLLNQYRHDIAMNVMWTGTHSAPTPGVANNAVDTADGYGKIINDEITATTITPIATGTMTTSDACTKIEQFLDAIMLLPSANTKRWGLHVSQQTLMKYKRSYRTLHGETTHAKDMFGRPVVEGYENVSFIVEAGIPDNALVLSREGNLYVGVDGPPSLIIEREKRMTYFLWDFFLGFNFSSTNDIFVNDIPVV